jgi:hypothetical protein
VQPTARRPVAAHVELVRGTQLPPGMRYNDGKVDPWAHLWVGSMALDESRAISPSPTGSAGLPTANTCATLIPRPPWPSGGSTAHRYGSLSEERQSGALLSADG